MAKTKKLKDLGVISDLTGASIIGLDAAGNDARFPIANIVRSEKGLATPNGTPGGTRFAGETWLVSPSNYGSTFTNWGGIVVPLKVGAQYVSNARLVWNAGAWSLQYELVDGPVLTDYVAKSAVVDNQISTSVNSPLSANQGRLISETALTTAKSTAKKILNISFSDGSFVRNDGSLGSNANYKRLFNTAFSKYIPNGGKIYADYGNEGASLVGIAKFNNATASTSSFVAFQDQGVATGAVQKRFVEIIQDPGATHFMVSSNKLYELNIYAVDNKGLVSVFSAASRKQDVDMIAGFISNSTNEAANNAGYDHTAALPLALLMPDATVDKILVDISNKGASNRPISFYSSAEISAANYVGALLTGTNTNPTPYVDYDVIPPVGATHVVFSRDITTEFNLKLMSGYKMPYNGPKSEINKINTSLVFADNAFPLLGESKQLWIRAATKRLFGNSFPLWVMFGQSNTDGRAPKTSAPSWLVALNYKIEWYQVWNRITKKFQAYELGVNTGSDTNDDTKFSFDIFLAKKHYDTYGKTIYCIKHTNGGTPISEKGAASVTARFQPKTELITNGDRKMADEFIVKVNEAYTYLNAYDIKVQLLFTAFIQGESDADNALRLADYPNNLANLIYFIKGVFAAPDLPILISQIIDRNSSYTQVNTAFTNAAALDNTIHVRSTSGHQTNIGDGLHYDAAALEYIATAPRTTEDPTGGFFYIWQQNYAPIYIS
jgi:hypothetical protein